MLTDGERDIVDWSGKAKVHGGDPKLPDRRAAVPAKVQAAFGTPVQDWCVLIIRPFSQCQLIVICSQA